MAQSLSRIAVHLVFSTKNRHPWLEPVEVRDELYAYMATVLRNNVDSPAIIINGVKDHVHILCVLSRKFPIMKVVQVAKTETSKWLKKRLSDCPHFSWQNGYGAFSVSESKLAQVKQYIRTQDKHHRETSFQNELRELCRLHNIVLDDRYAWE